MVQLPKAKMNIPMCMACVLLCLTLFSTYLTGGLYARYISRDDFEDSARVAKFDVDLSSNSDKVDIRLERSTTGNYSFIIHNKSEVAIKYDILLTFNKELPSYVKVTLNGKGGTKPEGDANSLLFENVGTVAPNVPDTDNTLVFEVSSLDDFLGSATGQNHSFEIDFTASVNCEQID